MRAITLWIILCAFLNCAGWILSALHQLNAGGYAVVLALGLAGLVAWRKVSGAPFFPELRWQRLRRRFRRGFPLAFLALACLAFLGGALYAPANYDALAYRTPRVLHWLAAGQWHWLDTEFQRLNTRTTGFEWLTAPLFLFTGSDHLVFLLNIISFVLLPGRFYALLTRLGVQRTTAWYWMWLFPSGYGYALQAGSVANDMFGAVLALAAMEFALRACRTKEPSDVWIALLAGAMMTSVKAYNLLLLPALALAMLPALKLLLRRPLISMSVFLFAAMASLLPTAALNWRQCHDWTGLAIEQPSIGGSGKPYRLLANVVNLPLDNLVPPFFPLSVQWDHLMNRLVPAQLEASMRANMELDLARFHLPEMQVEEIAGLGMGLTLLLGVVLVKKIRTARFQPSRLISMGNLISLTAWACLGVFMLQVGATGPARYLLPFYPLLLAPVLAGPIAAGVFRTRSWRGAAGLVFGATVLLLVLSPPRPLWPASRVMQTLNAEHSNHHLLQRMNNVYAAYATRAAGFASIIPSLPLDAQTIGYLAFDEPEAALWRPFGSRRVVHFSHTDSPEHLRAQGIKYALVSQYTLTNWCRVNSADWLRQMHSTTLQHFELKLLARQEPRDWLLIRIN